MRWRVRVYAWWRIERTERGVWGNRQAGKRAQLIRGKNGARTNGARIHPNERTLPLRRITRHGAHLLEVSGAKLPLRVRRDVRHCVQVRDDSARGAAAQLRIANAVRERRAGRLA